MPRGNNGKSMFGGTGTAAQTVAVSKFLQNLNSNTQTQGNVKNVEDLQAIIGFFNVTVANISAAKKTLTS
jgi:hypothetical protein